jgi:hypothetical protein
VGFFLLVGAGGCSAADPGAPLERPTRPPASDASLPPADTATDAAADAAESLPDLDAGVDGSSDAEAGAPAPLRCVACINAGGNGFTASNGRVFVADTGADAGRTYTSPNPVNGTNDGAMYQSERFGQTFAYAIQVPNGTYTLNLHFAEVFWTQTGQRVFNVDVQGARVLSNYDILQEVAANAPVVKTFNATVTDGTLTVAFSTVVDNAKVAGIEVLGR